MKKHEEIDRVCAYCEHLQYIVPQPTKKSKNPVTYLSFLAALDGEIEATPQCKYKKAVALDGCCHRFRYDPLKRKPNLQTDIPLLDPESIFEAPKI